MPICLLVEHEHGVFDLKQTKLGLLVGNKPGVPTAKSRNLAKGECYGNRGWQTVNHTAMKK